MEPYKQALVSFMKSMQDWELKCAKREELCDSGVMDYDESESIGINEYMDIYHQYCSNNATPRGYSFSEPPGYNPEGELIESVRAETSKYVEVITQQNYSFRKKHLYKLVFEDGSWKLLHKKILLNSGEELDTPL
jgi:hypothetical protein